MEQRDYRMRSGDCNAEQPVLLRKKPIIFQEGYETGMILSGYRRSIVNSHKRSCFRYYGKHALREIWTAYPSKNHHCKFL